MLAGTGALIEGQRKRARLDTPGAVTGTGVTFALVYGITRGGEHGWSDTVTLNAFVAAAVLAGVFLWL